MKQRLLSIIVLLLAIVAGVQAQTNLVYVGEKLLKDDGTYTASDIPDLKDGSITLNKSEKLLTLDGVVIETTSSER